VSDELERRAAAQAEQRFGPRGRDLVALVALVVEELARLATPPRGRGRRLLWHLFHESAAIRAHVYARGLRVEESAKELDVDAAIARGRRILHQLRVLNGRPGP